MKCSINAEKKGQKKSTLIQKYATSIVFASKIINSEKAQYAFNNSTAEHSLFRRAFLSKKYTAIATEMQMPLAKSEIHERRFNRSASNRIYPLSLLNHARVVYVA